MNGLTAALQVVVLGIGVTLTALLLLYLVLNAFGRIFIQKIKAPERELINTARAKVSVEPPTSGLDERLVAAIAGSVSTLLMAEQHEQPFKMRINPVSVKTVRTGKTWALAGRKDLMTGTQQLAALRRRGSHTEI